MILRLPPAQPPADDVADITEHLAAVRAEIAHAESTFALLLAAANDDTVGLDLTVWADYRRVTRYALELRLARERLDTWRGELAHAEARAARLGVSL